MATSETTDHINVDTRIGLVLQIPVSQLRPSHLNPRRDMGDLDTLGASLKDGQITDLLVYPSPGVEDDFEVLDGHRRLAAARRADILSLSCKVVDAPKDLAEAVATMLTAGRTGKRLAQSEIADGVQTMLDLGMDVETIRRRTRLDESQVKVLSALSAAPSAVREHVDEQQNLEAMLALQEAREAFADDVETLERLEEVADKDPGNLKWRVRNFINSRNRKRVDELLVEAGVKSAPDTLRYRDYEGVNGAQRHYSAPLEELLTRDRENLVNEFRALAGEGWTVLNFNGDRLDWYPKPVKTAAAPKAEPTEEERREAAARDEVRLQLTRAVEHLDEWVTGQLARPMPAKANTFGPGHAQRLLVDLAMEQIRYQQYAKDRTLLTWAGLPTTQDPEQWDTIVLPAAKTLFQSKKWQWLAVFLTLSGHLTDREVIKNFRPLEVSYYARQEATEHVQWLHDVLGYEAPEDLTKALAYLGRDDAPEGTVVCEGCGQTVSTDQDWNGVCKECEDQQ